MSISPLATISHVSKETLHWPGQTCDPFQGHARELRIIYPAANGANCLAVIRRVRRLRHLLAMKAAARSRRELALGLHERLAQELRCSLERRDAVVHHLRHKGGVLGRGPALFRLRRPW